MAHQRILGYSVLYDGVEDVMEEYDIIKASRDVPNIRFRYRIAGNTI